MRSLQKAVWRKRTKRPHLQRPNLGPLLLELHARGSNFLRAALWRSSKGSHDDAAIGQRSIDRRIDSVLLARLDASVQNIEILAGLRQSVERKPSAKPSLLFEQDVSKRRTAPIVIAHLEILVMRVQGVTEIRTVRFI